MSPAYVRGWRKRATRVARCGAFSASLSSRAGATSTANRYATYGTVGGACGAFSHCTRNAGARKDINQETRHNTPPRTRP